MEKLNPGVDYSMRARRYLNILFCVGPNLARTRSISH